MRKETGDDGDNFRALERELKYIQGSLYLHIRYSMIRAKHVEDERQKMKGK
jgi:hypothetical protein